MSYANVRAINLVIPSVLIEFRSGVIPQDEDQKEAINPIRLISPGSPRFAYSSLDDLPFLSSLRGPRLVLFCRHLFSERNCPISWVQKKKFKALGTVRIINPGNDSKLAHKWAPSFIFRGYSRGGSELFRSSKVRGDRKPNSIYAHLFLGRTVSIMLRLVRVEKHIFISMYKTEKKPYKFFTEVVYFSSGHKKD